MSEEAQNKIDVLERALRRERAARKLAEMQLENYTRELLEQEVLNDETRMEVENQQTQLSFLTGLLAETWSKPTLNKIVENYLERTCAFLSKPDNLFIELDNLCNYGQFQYYTQSSTESEINEHLQLLKSFLAQLDREKVFDLLLQEQETQLIDTSDISNEAVGFYQFCVMVPLYTLTLEDKKTVGVAVLLYEDQQDINITKLQTLESSRSMLSIAIERKRAEEELQQQLMNLEETNKVLEQTQLQLVGQEKLASLGYLAAGVAHEINNPVGFVISNLDTMADYIKDIKSALQPLTDERSNTSLSTLNKNYEEFELPFLFEDSDEILKSSVEGLERVKAIVADLSTFSRMDNDELEPIDVTKVINKSLNMVSNEFKYKHHIETDLLESATILGIESKLQQVFVNLFVNAKQAMAEGGTLFVRCYRERTKIIVRVKDEGKGISRENLKEIFTPFFTTKAPGEGTGLGLSISYSILQQHNAKVEVLSEPDKGTEFVISFFEFF
ncbi:sensor histidine kinase [Pseudoalteromonas sp. MTN2-4]|uniref:sensor histidine kinase n=1 Tax=Pseudoalteromonas sp. MTN2-4 TaxID=3056555 RepID=UPI0036F358CC